MLGVRTGILDYHVIVSRRGKADRVDIVPSVWNHFILPPVNGAAHALRGTSPIEMQKITWNWLAPRLEALNVSWLEKAAGLRDKRLNDVKRGKSTLTEEELARIAKALRFLDPER